jgi:hypothetical protein
MYMQYAKPSVERLKIIAQMELSKSEFCQKYPEECFS